MSRSLLPSNVAHKIKVLSKYVSVQLVVQALSLASGIFIVRSLDQQQYAFFTIANTMQATMNLLADTGIGISLSAIGGKVWQDRYRFGQLINTAMQLRYSLAVISVTVVTPILIWMLIHNGASAGYAIVITVVTLIGFTYQLTTDVLMVVPRLHSEIDKIQNINLFSSIARLFLLGVASLTFLNTAIAITFTSIITGLQRLFLGYWVKRNIDFKATINQEDKKEIFTLIKHQLPNSIYYCFQGQLIILLISFFGNVKSIADIGALGRLGIIFSIINDVMSNIVLPSFSRSHSANVLWKNYLKVMTSISIISALILSIVYFFPSQILWVLGNKYAHLNKELLLIVMNTLFSSLVGSMWSINAAKGWIKYSWINIPFTIFVQIITLLVLDISELINVIIFSLLSQLPPFIVNIFLTFRGIYLSKKSNFNTL